MTTATENIDKGLTGIWGNLLKDYSGQTAILDRYSGFELTYKELYRLIRCFASGLQALGLKKNEHVSLFSENSSKWFIADQAILMCGAINAVRGSQSPADELLYILGHSDSKGLIAEDLDTTDKLKDCSLDFIICLSEEEIPREISREYKVYGFKEIVSLGEKHAFHPVRIDKQDLATIVYTSGTTGKPKGVMLTHGNLLSQITSFIQPLGLSAGKKALNILPTWHVYERTCEYYILSRGVTMVYTNVPNFRGDIKRYNPEYLVAVPRIWEAVYEGVHAEIKKLPFLRKKIVNFVLKTGQFYVKKRRIITDMCTEKKGDKLSNFIKSCLAYPFYKAGEKLVYGKLRSALGNSFKLGISGGGLLAGHLEDFYETIGINIIVGYGLTESSPVLTMRRPGYNLRNSAGKPVSGTEIRIREGVVYARGPQVMKGYYKDEKATNEVLFSDGWLNTGDLGWLTPGNDLVLTGRKKDLIVLSSGENIEPQPLEHILLKSPYIYQVMLVGQDRAHLGALIVPTPDMAGNPELHKILKKELKEHIQNRANFRPFERIQCFRVIEEPFSADNGLLTRTMKVKKTEVYKKYGHLADEMFRQ